MTSLLTVDVWDTLLRRDCHPECIKLATAYHLLLGKYDHIKSNYRSLPDLYQARLGAEQVLAAETQSRGGDNEYDIESVFSRWLQDVLVNPNLAWVSDLVEFEVKTEISRSYKDPGIVDFIARHPSDRVFFLSDFYMGSDKLMRILESKGLDTLFSGGVSSCDIEMNKRSGKAYEFVHAQYGVSPDQHTHIGDNIWSDIQSARGMGIQAVHYLPDSEHAKRMERERLFASQEILIDHISEQCASRLRDASADLSCEQRGAFELGARTAPIFIGYALWIAQQAIQEKLDRVYFLTREGEFFYSVFRSLFPDGTLFGHNLPPADVLEVSRLSTFLPSLRAPFFEDMSRVWSIYKEQSLSGLCKTLGLKANDFENLFAAIGLSETSILTHPDSSELLRQLFEEPEWVDAIRDVQASQSALLREYLKAKGLQSGGRFGVVDIGWRGTIQDNIALLLPNTHFHGMYMGLFGFRNEQPSNTTKRAFVVDQNQSSIPSALFANYSILEILCNSPNGSVTGYEKGVKGVCAQRLIHSDENRSYTDYVQYFQRGVLFSSQQWKGGLERYAVSADELKPLALGLWAELLRSSSEGLSQIYLNNPQNELFGYGQFMSRNHFPSLLTICLAPIVPHKRRELIAFIKKTAWYPSIRHCKDMSFLHRYVLYIACCVGNGVKSLYLKIQFAWRRIQDRR